MVKNFMLCHRHHPNSVRLQGMDPLAAAAKYADCQDDKLEYAMCPQCKYVWDDPDTTRCTGVVGAAQPAQGVTSFDPTNSIFQYGNKQYAQGLQATDNSPCGSAGSLGFYDKNGGCVTGSGPGGAANNNSKKAQTTPLVVNDWGLSSASPLQALHKIWGDAIVQGGKDVHNFTNNGVSKENVYVSASKETVMVGSKQVKQKVLCLEAHGDHYTGDVQGMWKKGGTSVQGWPACPTYEQDFTASGAPTPAGGQANRRVGGVACTRQQYGPGVYNALCYIPKTSDANTDGRGYVFAAWTFHAEEIYEGGVASNGDQYRSYSKYPCYGECDGGYIGVGGKCPNPGAEGKFGGTGAANCGVDVNKDAIHDTFSSITHEIDIEIPTNAPGLDWKKDMGWNTMNCNTWVADNANYDEDTGSYYMQATARRKTETFISTQPESSSNKDYHWYTIHWYVDPNGDYTKNFVAFYFDAPFDPSGTAKDPTGTLIPRKPSQPPIYSTRRFVPTRPGRYNIGAWFGWWGYGAHDGLKPNFDTAIVRLAHLSIIPQQGLTPADFPQNYDQTNLECDFVDFSSTPPTGGGSDPPDPTTGVDCAVSGWGPCSETCGGGTHSRTVTTPASGGGAACPALSQACNTSACDDEQAMPPWAIGLIIAWAVMIVGGIIFATWRRSKPSARKKIN